MGRPTEEIQQLAVVAAVVVAIQTERGTQGRREQLIRDMGAVTLAVVVRLVVVVAVELAVQVHQGICRLAVTLDLD